MCAIRDVVPRYNKAARRSARSTRRLRSARKRPQTDIVIALYHDSCRAVKHDSPADLCLSPYHAAARSRLNHRGAVVRSKAPELKVERYTEGRFAARKLG